MADLKKSDGGRPRLSTADSRTCNFACCVYITYLLTYLLTPRCRVLLEKLTGLQLVKKFSSASFPPTVSTPKFHTHTKQETKLQYCYSYGPKICFWIEPSNICIVGVTVLVWGSWRRRFRRLRSQKTLIAWQQGDVVCGTTVLPLVHKNRLPDIDTICIFDQTHRVAFYRTNICAFQTVYWDNAERWRWREGKVVPVRGTESVGRQNAY